MPGYGPPRSDLLPSKTIESTAQRESHSATMIFEMNGSGRPLLTSAQQERLQFWQQQIEQGHCLPIDEAIGLIADLENLTIDDVSSWFDTDHLRKPVAERPEPAQDYCFDHTGHGVPRVIAGVWEEKRALCFQVEANGIRVSRKEDDRMINGSQLWKVASLRKSGLSFSGLTRDKSSDQVKFESGYLKGIW